MHAVWNTHSPICMIIPVSSAGEINSPEKIMPLTECRQLTNASAPQILEVLLSTISW
jgi:hypothetical protein